MTEVSALSQSLLSHCGFVSRASSVPTDQGLMLNSNSRMPLNALVQVREEALLQRICLALRAAVKKIEDNIFCVPLKRTLKNSWRL